MRRYTMLLALLLPWIVHAGLGPFWVRTLDFALLYAMLALGLNTVVGFAGLLDLGYIAFYAVGAYTYALLDSPQFGLHWSFWVVLPLCSLMAAFFGVLLGTPTLRLRGDYLAIVTLGFGEIVRLFMNNLDQPVNITNGPQGISGIDPLPLGRGFMDQGLSVGSWHVDASILYYLVFLGVLWFLYVIAYRLQHSRTGRAWVALREDEMAAAAMGIPLRNIKLLAFALGASFGGLAGGLFAAFQGFVSPESFSLMESIMVLCMVVLGGMGHLPGVIFGAVLLTLMPEVLRSLAPLLGGHGIDPENLRMLIFGCCLIVVMIFRPQGLWPSRLRAREWQHD
ncbi:MAG: ABC transporter ATP-binding protein [Pseudomonadales bacterium]|nr:ABC transporter ATP-binding protein [Pseudomonadales bacterium]